MCSFWACLYLYIVFVYEKPISLYQKPTGSILPLSLRLKFLRMKQLSEIPQSLKGNVSTTHFKPTDIQLHVFLFLSSYWCKKKGFIEGEALRLLRTNSFLEESITNLRSHLRVQGYPNNLVKGQTIRKVMQGWDFFSLQECIFHFHCLCRNLFIGIFIYLLIDWWLIDWLINWLIDWMTDWLIDWLIDWFFGGRLLYCRSINLTLATIWLPATSFKQTFAFIFLSVL